MTRRQPPTKTISVHVPFAIRKYGGRKRLLTPNGEAAAIEKFRVDSTLIKALAPDIVEAILDGRHPPEMTLAALLVPFPVEWNGQRGPTS